MASPAHPGYTLGVFDGGILEERLRRLLDGRAANVRQARLLLIGCLSALAVCAVAASGLALSARAQGGARPELTAGAEAFNHRDLAAAIRHFDAAVHLEPANLLAKLHLANAYAVANDRQNARRQYEDVLALDPANRSAILGLVSVSGGRRIAALARAAPEAARSQSRGCGGLHLQSDPELEYAYPRVQQA